jgi:hypothetical protein
MKRPRKPIHVFWHFVAERQNVFYRRLAGKSAPWTNDPVLRTYKFTNTFRVADHVTQYMLSTVMKKKRPPVDEFFRITLFRALFNTDTWEFLDGRVDIGATGWDKHEIMKCLRSRAANHTVFGDAYQACYSPSYGFKRVFENRVEFIDRLLRKGFFKKVAEASTLGEVVRMFMKWPGVGPFYAWQYAVDINYSRHLGFDENTILDGTDLGCGAVDGARRVFGAREQSERREVVLEIINNQDEEVRRYGPFESEEHGHTLFGRRLTVVDVEHCLCETSKYLKILEGGIKPKRLSTRMEIIGMKV